MRDLQSPEATFTSVGRKYGLSNTTIIRIFDTRVELSRLPLSPYICIDENYAIREGNSKYVCVLVDFETQDVIDVLPNRYKADLRRYFLSIPEPERMKVKAVGIDMYETYREIVTQCFPSSTKVAIDRFHLVKEFTKQADTVRKDVTDRIKRERDSLKRQKDKLKESPVFLSQPVQREYRKVKDKYWKRSSEYYLLKKYNWFLFKDPGDDLFDVNRKKHYNSHFHEYLNYSDLKTKMYSLIPSMSEIERFRVHLSELYTYKTAEDAAGCLDKLIKELESCEIKEMKHFAGTLKRWRIEILNSVTVLTQIYEVQTDGDVIIRDRRLNNGVIERKNKQIKVIKNVANGYSNFDRFRNRILYCLRSKPSFSYEKTYASKARKGIKRRAAG
jgi:transposase